MGPFENASLGKKTRYLDIFLALSRTIGLGMTCGGLKYQLQLCTVTFPGLIPIIFIGSISHFVSVFYVGSR